MLAIGFGERGAAKIRNLDTRQSSSLDISQEKIMQFCRGTSFETIFQEILSIDLTTKLGLGENKAYYKKIFKQQYQNCSGIS